MFSSKKWLIHLIHLKMNLTCWEMMCGGFFWITSCKGAAENLFSSPPYPHPLRFESLSLKTPQTVPPTLGTALQLKIEGKLEKSGPSKQAVELSNLNTQPNPHGSEHSDDHEPMEMDFCGPSLPPGFGQSAQSEHGSHPNRSVIHHSEQSEQPNNGCAHPEPKNTWTKRSTRFGQNISHSLHLQRRISPLSISESLLSPKGLLMSKINNKMIHTQSFIGR